MKFQFAYQFKRGDTCDYCGTVFGYPLCGLAIVDKELALSARAGLELSAQALEKARNIADNYAAGKICPKCGRPTPEAYASACRRGAIFYAWAAPLLGGRFRRRARVLLRMRGLGVLLGVVSYLLGLAVLDWKGNGGRFGGRRDLERTSGMRARGSAGSGGAALAFAKNGGADRGGVCRLGVLVDVGRRLRLGIWERRAAVDWRDASVFARVFLALAAGWEEDEEKLREIERRGERHFGCGWNYRESFEAAARGVFLTEANLNEALAQLAKLDDFCAAESARAVEILRSASELTPEGAEALRIAEAEVAAAEKKDDAE